MREYIKMVIFLGIISILSALILTGFYMQTKEKIDQNKQQDRLLHVAKAMRALPPAVETALQQDAQLTSMPNNTVKEKFDREAKYLERMEYHLKQQGISQLAIVFNEKITVLEIGPQPNYAMKIYAGKDFVVLPAHKIDYMRNIYIFKLQNPQQAVYAFEVAGSGFWDKISGYLALQQGFVQIAGISFYDHKETPGLGQRIEEGWFQTQFVTWQKQVIGQEGNIALHITKREGEYDGDSQHKKINEVDGITGASETSRALDRFIPQNLESVLHILGNVVDQPQVQQFFDSETLETLRKYKK